jgi:RNA polymerase sigma factor (sigma-70 family)
VIDPQEKNRLFAEALSRYNDWIGVVARNNAPTNSCEDLEQEIRISLWRSLDSFDGERSGLGTWLFLVAQRTAKDFRNKNQKLKKGDEAVYPHPVLVEQNRDQIRIIEDFTSQLGEPDRQVFTMYFDYFNYAEMSAAADIDEATLRKRLSRIKEQFKTKYQDY